MFLRAIAQETFGVELPKQYAVGMVFFNQDPVKAEAARENMNREILAAGLQLVGWRKVPIDTSVLGRLALERLPQIEQVFIGGEGLSDQDMAVKLFTPVVARPWPTPPTPTTTSAAFRTRPSFIKA
jgi:glutamate synthase (NADPH/NADH) large chain